jgi:DNA-binding winged helix-turn-helix (wHTH) protein
VLPPFKGSAKQKIVRGDIPWVRSGKRLEKLEDLCSVADEIATNSNTRRPCVAVGDVLFREDTWTFSIGPREISLGPVTAALFRVLLMNANRVVSNEKLMRCVPEDFDLSDLSKRIFILRGKLGSENESRIRTMRGAGYMYVTPEQSSGKAQQCNTDRLSILPGSLLAPPSDFNGNLSQLTESAGQFQRAGSRKSGMADGTGRVA